MMYLILLTAFFVNISPNIKNKMNVSGVDFSKFPPEPTPSSLFFNPINPNEIINITKDHVSKAQGHDRISTHVVTPPLTHINNLSLSFGECRKALKLAKINPVYKKR